MKTPIVAFRNLGNLKFEDMGPAWGLDQPGLPNGIAVGDLDNDGGLDFVVNNLGSAAGVYHNHGSAPRVAVRLKGPSAQHTGHRRENQIAGRRRAHAKPGGGVRGHVSFGIGPPAGVSRRARARA